MRYTNPRLLYFTLLYEKNTFISEQVVPGTINLASRRSVGGGGQTFGGRLEPPNLSLATGLRQSPEQDTRKNSSSAAVILSLS